MICPACGFSNIEGADDCGACGTDLSQQSISAAMSGLEIAVAAERIGAVASPGAVIVSPSTMVADVIAQLATGTHSCALVVDGGRLVGICSERDILLKAANRYEKTRSEPIRNFMTSDPEYLSEDATIAWALNRMDVGGFRHIPIVKHGKPFKVVSVKDILKHLAAHYCNAA
jgi:CBS domain-containing protein